MNHLLEVCVDSYASAMAAIAGGADRLELCSALSVGGLTPSAALLAQIRAVSKIPIRCLMRPRGGDFLYTREEVAQMAMEMASLRSAGADGFVIGCLTPEGELDGAAMELLLNAAAGLGLTLHRCIDVSRDLTKTYRDAANLGFDTVLTSGGAGNCVAGIDTISQLLVLRDRENGPEVLREKLPTARAFHMSGKTEIESRMRFRRENVPMGLPGLDEWHIQQTSEQAVREAKRVLDK